MGRIGGDPPARAIRYNRARSDVKSPPAQAGFVARIGAPLLLGVAPLVFLRSGAEFENNPKLGFLQWGIAVFALLWVARAGNGEATVWTRTPLDLPILAFCFGSLLSLTRAVNGFVALPVLMHLAACVILCFLLMRSLRGADALPRLFFAATVGCGVVGLIGIAQTHLGLAWIPQAVPPASTFANRNMAAHFVALCLPSILGLIVVSKAAGVRAFGWCSLLLSLVYLFSTRSLAAWVAVLVVISGFVVGWIMLRDKPSSGRTRSVPIIAVLLIGLALMGLFAARDDGNGDTTNQRLIYWKNTLAMAWDQPLLGVGPGNFALQYPRYHRAAEVDWTFDEEHQLQRTHNDHLQVFAERGLVGLVAWLWIFGVALHMAWRLLRTGQDWIRAQALFVCLGIVAIASLACFSFPLQRAMPPVYLFAYLGMLGFLYQASEAEPARGISLSVWVRLSAGLLLGLYLAGSFVVLRKAISTDVLYAEGLRLTNAGRYEQAVAVLAEARGRSPRDAGVLLMLAKAHAGSGSCDLALAPLDEVLRLQPHNVNAISNVGTCYLQLKDYTAAESNLLQLQQILPDSPWVQTNLGTTYYRQQKVEQAVDAYRKAIGLGRTTLSLPGARLEARLLQPRLLLARLYVEEGRLVQAIAQYREILHIAPDRSEVRRLLAELYRETGQPEKAFQLDRSAGPPDPR
jgi:O-antigen ligase/Flp pilus assembly protein TadD